MGAFNLAALSPQCRFSIFLKPFTIKYIHGLRPDSEYNSAIEQTSYQVKNYITIMDQLYVTQHRSTYHCVMCF